MRGYGSGMVRIVLVCAAVAAMLVVLKQRSDSVAGSALTSPPAASAQVPQEFRELVAMNPDPSSMLRRRGALPGLGAIRRLTGGSAKVQEPVSRPFADVGSRRALREVRADIRRDLAALNRLSAKGGASPAQAEQTLAEVYSAPVLAALGPDGRHAFAEQVAGRTRAAQRIKLRDFEGVFVAGRRALAQVVYQLSVRAPSGRFVARAPQTWTVTLAREGDRWRFVRGFETG